MALYTASPSCGPGTPSPNAQYNSSPPHCKSSTTRWYDTAVRAATRAHDSLITWYRKRQCQYFSQYNTHRPARSLVIQRGFAPQQAPRLWGFTTRVGPDRNVVLGLPCAVAGQPLCPPHARSPSCSRAGRER
eukprot:1065225-Rhodomonas_salina.1